MLSKSLISRTKIHLYKLQTILLILLLRNLDNILVLGLIVIIIRNFWFSMETNVIQKEINIWIALEAIVQRCSVKKVFLGISQNSQENTCARVSFLIKLQAWGLRMRNICLNCRRKQTEKAVPCQGWYNI